MHRKPRTINFPSLSEESKQYIRDNNKEKSKLQMMEFLKVSHKTITAFMDEENIKGRYAKRGIRNNLKKPEKVKESKSKFFDVDEACAWYK